MAKIKKAKKTIKLDKSKAYNKGPKKTKKWPFKLFSIILILALFPNIILGPLYLLTTNSTKTLGGYKDYISNVLQIEDINLKLEEKTEAVTQLTTDLETITAQKINVEAALAEKTNQLAEKEALIIEKETEIAEKQQALNEALANSDADAETIENLEAELAEAIDEKETLQHDIEDLEDNIEDFERDIEHLEEDIENLETELEDMTNYIAELEAFAIVDFEFLGELVNSYNITQQQDATVEGVSTELMVEEVEEGVFNYTLNLSFSEQETQITGVIIDSDYFADEIMNTLFFGIMGNITSNYNNNYVLTDVWAQIIDPINAGETEVVENIGYGIELSNTVEVYIWVDTEITINYLEEGSNETEENFIVNLYDNSRENMTTIINEEGPYDAYGLVLTYWLDFDHSKNEVRAKLSFDWQGEDGSYDIFDITVTLDEYTNLEIYNTYLDSYLMDNAIFEVISNGQVYTFDIYQIYTTDILDNINSGVTTELPNFIPSHNYFSELGFQTQLFYHNRY